MNTKFDHLRLNLLDEVEEQILKLNENDAWRLERERTFLLRKIEQQAKEDEKSKYDGELREIRQAKEDERERQQYK